MLEFSATKIPGLIRIDPGVLPDARGSFTKLLHAGTFAKAGLETEFRESYITTSKKGVLRGLHFQAPPADHAKLVYCVDGTVLDVVLDLRKGSPTFRQCWSGQLTGDAMDGLYIPRGCAHGFLTISESATLFYAVTSVYAPMLDTGIRWDSITFEWPRKEVFTSERDAAFTSLAEYISPFP